MADDCLWAGCVRQWPEEWCVCLKAIKLLGKWCQVQSKKWTTRRGLVSGSCRDGRASRWSVECNLTAKRTQCCSGEWMSLGFILTMMNDESEAICEISPLNELLTSKKAGKKETNLAYEVQMFSQAFCPSQFAIQFWTSDASAHSFSCLLRYASLN